MNPPTSNKNFKGQFNDELVLCFFRKHWIQVLSRVLVLPPILALIMLGFIFLEPLSRSGLFGAALGIFVIGALTYLVHYIFTDIFYYFLRTVMITNYRIVEVDRSVFFRDSKTSVDLSNIQDIQKRQSGVFQSLFNYGSLVIVLSGTSETLTITMVPRPEYQFKKINQVKSSYLPKRFSSLPSGSFVQVVPSFSQVVPSLQGESGQKDLAPTADRTLEGSLSFAE